MRMTRQRGCQLITGEDFDSHLFRYRTIWIQILGSDATMPHHCSDSALRSCLNSSDQLTSSFGFAGGPAIRGGVIGCERFMIDTLVDHYACMSSGAQAFFFFPKQRLPLWVLYSYSRSSGCVDYMAFGHLRLENQLGFQDLG